MNLDIKGFASAGVVSGDTQYEYISTNNTISESSSFGATNNVGFQLFANVNDKVTLTAQLLAKGAIDSYNLEAHWAYISYVINPSLQLRAGRLVLPTSMLSEYIDVGYALPWANPPAEIYSAALINSYSGFDLLFKIPIGSATLTLQPLIGSLPSTEFLGAEASVKRGAGLSTSLTLDHGTLTASYLDVSDIQANYKGQDVSADITFTSIGASFELDNTLFMIEGSERKATRPTESTASKLTSWYATLGYHFGKFLPHITFSRGYHNQPQMVIPAGTPYATPIGTIPLPEDIIIQPAPFSYRQESITAGLRYDMFNQMAIKVEAQEISPLDNSWGLFVKDPGDKAYFYSAAVNVTF